MIEHSSKIELSRLESILERSVALLEKACTRIEALYSERFGELPNLSQVESIARLRVNFNFYEFAKSCELELLGGSTWEILLGKQVSDTGYKPCGYEIGHHLIKFYEQRALEQHGFSQATASLALEVAAGRRLYQPPVFEYEYRLRKFEELVSVESQEVVCALFKDLYSIDLEVGMALGNSAAEAEKTGTQSLVQENTGDTLFNPSISNGLFMKGAGFNEQEIEPGELFQRIKSELETWMGLAIRSDRLGDC